jgi:hypothetical protein
MTRYERVDSEPCYGIAISIEKQGIGGVPSSDERPEFSHCLFPEWAEPNLPAFSTDLHRARPDASQLRSSIKVRATSVARAPRVVEEQEQGVISLAVLSHAIRGTKKLVYLIFFHVWDRIPPRSFIRILYPIEPKVDSCLLL